MKTWKRLFAAPMALAMLGTTTGGAGAWTLEEAAAPYSGATINIVCEGYPPCYALRDISAEFTERTGIEVVFEFGDLLAITQRMLAEQITESDYFDAMQVLSYYIPLYGEQNFYTPMSKFLDDPALRDPSFDEGDFVEALFQHSSYHGGVQVALPFQFHTTLTIMREDLLAHPGERAAFKEQHGYDLPESALISELETFDQWLDIARFFTRSAGETLAGETLESDFYGGLSPFKRHLSIFWTYWATLVAMGGEIYDADGNMALDRDETAVRALQWLLDMREASPPSYREYTWDDEYREFCAGNVFSLIYWPDAIFYLEDTKECKSAGNITYIPLPDTTTTMPFSYSYVVSPQAKNPEAAFLLQQWALSKQMQEVVTPKGWISTMRKDVMSADWSDYSQVEGSIMIGDIIAQRQKYYRVPGHPAMIASQDIMMDELSAAGADQIDAATAIANISARLRKLTGQ